MHIAIIGNGISGITAARFLRKLSSHRITVISGESEHFFSRTALMYAYMGHMRFADLKPYEDWFWAQNKIELKKGWVEKVDFAAQALHFATGEEMRYDRLILATGSKPNKFGWPGQDLEGVGGLYHLQDLERMEAFSPGLQRAVVVGGGLIGVEMAEMFHARHIPVTFLVREDSYWDAVLPAEESAMVSRHIREHGIDLRLGTELKEILDDGQGRAGGVVTSDGEQIPCGFVGLTAGVHPNIGFLSDTPLETGRGILVDEHLQTNIPGVFAIGDCAELRRPRPGRRAVEAVWYTGRMMGETAAYNICGQRVPYNPGIWFNSAKFMDIEYQVYGDVSGRPPEGHASVYWEHPDGRRSIRIVYSRESKQVLGFNLMGIRYRHEVCERWLSEGAHIETVLANLSAANFDPEFFAAFEQEVVAVYNLYEGRKVRLKGRRGLSSALRLLRSAVTGKPL